MIITDIKSKELSLYAKSNPYFARAFEDIEKIIAEKTEVGKYIVEEDTYFYMVQEYEAKEPQDSKFEVHEKFIDIQVVLEGEEEIRFDLPERLKPGKEPKGDNVYYLIDSDTCDTTILSAGELAIIFPGEAHAPGIRHSEDKKNVRKIVFKIKY
ncbi:MAG: YhcH/YjgK/YiaL family protein [Clostridia bacterium]|nr:YhcH/YjgK/YiaL family protein [Clostridia bacterium]